MKHYWKLGYIVCMSILFCPIGVKANTDVNQIEVAYVYGEDTTRESDTEATEVEDAMIEEELEHQTDECDPEDPEEEENPEDAEEEELPYEIDETNWAKAKLSDTYITRAKSTSYELQMNYIPEVTTNYTITWTSSNKKIATVDNYGNVTAIKKGTTTIVCTIQTESGYKKELTCEIVVTNPKFSKKTYVVAKSEQLWLELTGTETTKYKISGSNDDVLKVYKKQKGLVRGKKKGNATVTLEVDGIAIQCEVVVSNPKVKKDLFVLKKQETDTIQVYNHSGNQQPIYTSKHPKIATVSKTGKITPHKLGVAVIIVEVDQKEFEITVSIGRPKAVEAIRYAQRALGATYSQAYRMRAGYYDCSSLIWRAYRPTGLTFGYSKYASNAPTAAGEAYYLVSKKKEISSSYVDEKKLKPGDVIFISTGYNGRFRNITHVVMYIGNDIIIHATPLNGNCVQYGSYAKYRNTIVSIGRPTM